MHFGNQIGHLGSISRTLSPACDVVRHVTGPDGNQPRHASARSIKAISDVISLLIRAAVFGLGFIHLDGDDNLNCYQGLAGILVTHPDFACSCNRKSVL